MTRTGPPGWWDGDDVTVRLVRRFDGSTVLVVIWCALPWVLHQPVLLESDVD